MMFHILVADPLSEEGLKPLREHSDINVSVQTELSPEALLAEIPTYDALIVRSQTSVTAELLEKADRLKIIGRAGVGTDNIDLQAATQRGIIVVNAPHGNTNSAAEHTMAMIMSLSRNIPQAYHSLKQHEWNRKKFLGTELKGKTLGIVGLGRIGTEVAFRAKGQRMQVIAFDPFLTEEKAEKIGIGYGSLEEVLKAADFITVHTPLLKNTRHLINAEAFKLMKDNVQIVNCARGGIIDEEALYDAIVSGKVAGAALDVFENEPALENKLLTLPEVIATPHLGASTVEAQENVAIDVSQDIACYLQGSAAANPVNIPAISNEHMGKVKPYFLLAEKLGEFVSYQSDEAIEEIVLNYAGDVSEYEVTPLSRIAIKGLLKRHLGDHVNEVNAMYLAEKKGITVHENKTKTTKGFTNLLRIDIVTGKRTVTAAGTLLNGLGPRIVHVDQFHVDVTPTGHIVLIHHRDQPGVIGKMGNLLGTHHINIATMQVDRWDEGGKAIMLLKVDRHLEPDSISALKALPEIEDVRTIDF
ncbi:phosphoglycerate dehydrogenase [Virgibacillus halophilus]|uniref:D-3-phosphoglycerate dehydrogenase n=1 Tax=Tigheibacillus halophilus TaxID=361280 RepID=A0ABU5CA21_9BACI|nr:phosphoglycerate dehydrogenase [Virgibacillus halophilus]